MAPANNILKDEPDDSPRNVVDGTGRRDGTCTAEDDWETRDRWLNVI